MSSGGAGPVVTKPTLGLPDGYTGETELLSTAGRPCHPTHLVAAYARPNGRQLFVVEADGGVDSPAGNFSMSPQEVVAVDPAVALDPVARVATQNGPVGVHCSFVTFTYYFVALFCFRYRFVQKNRRQILSCRLCSIYYSPHFIVVRIIFISPIIIYLDVFMYLFFPP